MSNSYAAKTYFYALFFDFLTEDPNVYSQEEEDIAGADDAILEIE
jgi:hypothetical protein